MSHFLLGDQYPINTVEQIKTASAYVESYISRFHPEDRVVMACTIEKRASELGTSIEDSWVKNYGRFLKESSYSPEFVTMMNMRKTASHGRSVVVGESAVPVSDVIDMLVKAAEVTAPQDMAVLISDFDKTAGLDGMYDYDIQDPFFTVLGSVANPAYDEEKVAGMTVAEIKSLAGTEKMSKLASIIGDGCKTLLGDPVAFMKANPALESLVEANLR